MNLKYATHNRTPFFDLALNYIKDDDKVLDLGAGSGAFSKHCNRNDFYQFDGNQSTVVNLQKIYANSFYGLLPKLDFADDLFNVIHCSHVVEHLAPDEFYETLKEMDRCLKKGGFLIISAPLLWSGFFNDLSHVRPYNPRVYLNYLCNNQSSSRTRSTIANNYTQEKLVYRYCLADNEINYTLKKTNLIFKFFSKLLNIIFRRGFQVYEKTGYTIVLKKN